MEHVEIEQAKKAMANFDRSMSARHQQPVIPFEEFILILSQNPATVMRNVFQAFHDMIKTNVGEGTDEYPNDPESIHFVDYDFSTLFVDGTDHPFFADRLFANRLMNLVEAMRRGAQQNKIYIFDGPPGSGKSTFLNNLLLKFEEYTKTEQGLRYEAVWRLNRSLLCKFAEHEQMPMYDNLVQFSEKRLQESNLPVVAGADPCDSEDNNENPLNQMSPHFNGDYIEVPCPSHDHPILMIPKHYRRTFFDDLLLNDEFKWRLFTEKEYDWVFRRPPCTICSSIYWALLNRLKSPQKVFRMMFARPYQFNRRLGEGISVFNPGDKPLRQNILNNPMLQSRINDMLRDSNQVRYLFSRYAKTNSGIYALMDIKSHNIERLVQLHNIVSEGVHKVEDVEENVNSLFLALMNPEDKKNIEDIQSFSDRIEYIRIPYVMDLNTEVDIYRNIFGKHIDRSFLPRVLHNFARVIISSRLKTRSEALLEWIGDPKKYQRYCDENLQLLKMEIYTGHIPPWLSEEDRKRFTAKRRRKIIAESESEGTKGFSGRDSINIFGEFYSRYASEDKLINMSDVCFFFAKIRKDLSEFIPDNFLESLLNMYDYAILQEVKEALYYYNEEQISRDLQNYLFAVNFEPGSSEISNYTGDRLEISEEFFANIEKNILGSKVKKNQRLTFRQETQKEYTTTTLTQEIMVDGHAITNTKLYRSLLERYIYNLKEKVLDPFLENENFRQSIKDYGTEAFKTYDKKIKNDVAFLMNNLCEKSKYTELGAKEVCMYVIDHDLAKKFGLNL